MSNTATFHDGFVTLDCLDGSYPASISSVRWNGWANPAFTRDVADQVIQDLMRHELELRGFLTLEWHREETDSYTFGGEFICIHDESADEVEFVAPDADGLYPLGNFSWCWYEED